MLTPHPLSLKGIAPNGAMKLLTAHGHDVSTTLPLWSTASYDVSCYSLGIHQG